MAAPVCLVSTRSTAAAAGKVGLQYIESENGKRFTEFMETQGSLVADLQASRWIAHLAREHGTSALEAFASQISAAARQNGWDKPVIQPRWRPRCSRPEVRVPSCFRLSQAM